MEKSHFSDECRVEIHPIRRRYVRRPVGQRFKDIFTSKGDAFGGQSLMVWGAIKSTGERSLIRCTGNVNSKEYQRVLKVGLLPLYEMEDIYVHDNAPSHKARSTAEFLHSKGICVIHDWPAKNADINIIENLWCHLKRELASEPAESLDELWKICQDVWNSIDTSYIQKLYDSIPARINEVLINHGACCSY